MRYIRWSLVAIMAIATGCSDGTAPVPVSNIQVQARIIELTYANNVGRLAMHVGTPTSGPDLIVDGVSSTQHHVNAGEGPWMVNFRAVNMGTSASTSPTTMAAYLSRDNVFSTGDRFLAEVSLAPLAGGGFVDDSIAITMPTGIVSGQYVNVVLVADDDRVIPEPNELSNDNAYSLHVGTPAGSLPDLTVEGITSPQHNLNPGEATTLQFRVHNMGQAVASATVAKVYLSRDRTKSTNDILLGQTNVPGMAQGTFQTVSQSVTIPALPANGYAYILVEANAN